MRPDMIILYVADPLSSAKFYADRLGHEPKELSPGFGLFALASGLMLGLWRKDAVAPDATLGGVGGGEIVFHVESEDQVLAAFSQWSGEGVAILDQPVAREFGFSFVAADPDGHRIRVLKTAG